MPMKSTQPLRRRAQPHVPAGRGSGGLPQQVQQGILAPSGAEDQRHGIKTPSVWTEHSIQNFKTLFLLFFFLNKAVVKEFRKS